MGDLLREAAREVPDRVALVAGLPGDDPPRQWTYAELLEDAERAARGLLVRVKSGEHVAVWAPNLPEWVVLELAAALAGVVLVTVNPAFRPAELRYVLRQSRAAAIFLVPEFRGNRMAESLEEVRPELEHLRETVLFDDWDAFLASGDPARVLPDVRPDDVVQIQYTSGTTGFPKGALLRHRGVVNNARLTAQRWEIGGGDVWVNPLPLFHTGGCVLAVLGALNARATQVPVLAFDPKLVLDLVEREGATVLGAVPTMLIALLEQPEFAARDLSSLRVVASGGSSVPADLVRRFERELGVRFGIVFGQTESSPVITQTRLDDSPEDKADTIGQPLPQTEVKIADPATGDPLRVGEVGEICTRGYLVMAGYFDLPEATAEAIDEDGWLHTGDLGSMDERGYLRITGRLKDLIIRGGENIYPREIEDALFEHPAVAEAAVVGLPDAKWGELVAAFVRPSTREPPSEDELRSYLRERLAPHKTPERWIFVDDFPLTASGKVQKFLLRERLLAPAGS